MNQLQNQFVQTQELAMVDMQLPAHTISALIDSSVIGELLAGQAVKLVDSVDGVPALVPCSVNTDDVYGFINYNEKNKTWVAGQPVEISTGGNMIFLYSTGPISRGTQVVLDVSALAGVAQVSGAGNRIVGWAFDKAVGAGEVFRVVLDPGELDGSEPVCDWLTIFEAAYPGSGGVWTGDQCLAYESLGAMDFVLASIGAPEFGLGVPPGDCAIAMAVIAPAEYAANCT